MTAHSDDIRRIAARVRTEPGFKPAIGNSLAKAILEYSSTRYLSAEPELHADAKAIMARVPGEFRELPLAGVRGCE